MSDSPSRIGWQAYQRLAPAAYAALTALSQAVSASGIEKDLLELLKLRASQINGCAFCTQYHLNEARKLGIPSFKLDLLGVWREAGIFSGREKAALGWTEKLTRIADHHISDDDFAEVSGQFSEAEIVGLTTAIGLINTWNRIAGPLQFAPPIPRPAREEVHEAAHA